MKRIVQVVFLAAALCVAQSAAAMPLGLRMTTWGGTSEIAVEVALDAAGGVVDGEWGEQPSLTAAFYHEYGELPTATCDGYVFLGWTLDGVCVEANDIVRTSKPHTLTASWGIRIGNGIWATTICDEPITLGEPLVPPSGDVAIPATVAGRPIVGITDAAFAGNADITSVTVPQCICSSRLSAVFPASYQMITNVVVGADVEMLATGFFEGCDALETLTFLSPDTSIGDNDLRTIGRLYENQPDGYWVVQSSLVGYKGTCPGAIPQLDAIKRVMSGALEGCIALTDLAFTVESVLTEIGTNAFARCTELRRMTLPPSLVEIGNEAFMGCSYLGNVIVPGSVRRIGDRAFKNCTGFTAAQIEYGVGELGDEAFFADWRIREVDIPSSVTNIGANAFGGDSSMVRIGLRGDIRKASEIFSNYAHIREATVKDGDCAVVAGLFSGFGELQNVRFLGNCPTLEDNGTSLYADTDSALVTYVESDSTGWDGTPGSHSLPQAWPLVGGDRRPIEWRDLPSHLVQFDSNGGTLGVQDTYQHSERFFELPPEPVRTGCVFDGWWTQPDGGLPVTRDTVFIEGVYTCLYAHWTGAVVHGPSVTISPDDGTVFASSLTVTMTATDGAKIYYTADGSEPTTSSTRYGKKFRISGKTTIKAIAVVDGLPWSETAVASYALGTAADPMIAPPDGTVFGASQEVAIYWNESDGVVRYTLDGSDPTEESALYEGPFDVRTSCTVKAKVFSTTLFDSAVVAVALRQEWTIGIALGCANLDFKTMDENGWTRDVSMAYAVGGESMRSGNIGDDEESVLSTVVPTAGMLSFKWRTSCEYDELHEWDRLELRVDGEAVLVLDGDSDWQDGAYEFSDGPHTVEWVYVKDEAEFEGEDCAWVDEVVWTPSVAAEPIPVVADDATPEVVTNAIEAAGFADAAAVKAAIGGSAAEYNAFKAWAESVKVPIGDDGSMGSSSPTTAGAAAVVASPHAAAAFLLGAERLFENEPTVEIEEVAIGNDGEGGGAMGSSRPTIILSVTVKDGENSVAVSSEKVKEMFEATSDLGDWNGAAKLTPTVTVDDPAAGDSAETMRFKVTPGDGTAPRAFLRIRK